MGQPSTSTQVRAVALREAVASLTPLNTREYTVNQEDAQEVRIIERAERFANYIENGVEQDA